MAKKKHQATSLNKQVKPGFETGKARPATYGNTSLDLGGKRVHQVAKEFNISSKELLGMMPEGFNHHFQTVPEQIYSQLREASSGNMDAFSALNIDPFTQLEEPAPTKVERKVGKFVKEKPVAPLKNPMLSSHRKRQLEERKKVSQKLDTIKQNKEYRDKYFKQKYGSEVPHLGTMEAEELLRGRDLSTDEYLRRKQAHTDALQANAPKEDPSVRKPVEALEKKGPKGFRPPDYGKGDITRAQKLYGEGVKTESALLRETSSEAKVVLRKTLPNRRISESINAVPHQIQQLGRKFASRHPKVAAGIQIAGATLFLAGISGSKKQYQDADYNSIEGRKHAYSEYLSAHGINPSGANFSDFGSGLSHWAERVPAAKKRLKNLFYGMGETETVFHKARILPQHDLKAAQEVNIAAKIRPVHTDDIKTLTYSQAFKSEAKSPLKWLEEKYSRPKKISDWYEEIAPVGQLEKDLSKAVGIPVPAQFGTRTSVAGIDITPYHPFENPTAKRFSGILRAQNIRTGESGHIAPRVRTLDMQLETTIPQPPLDPINLKRTRYVHNQTVPTVGYSTPRSIGHTNRRQEAAAFNMKWESARVSTPPLSYNQFHRPIKLNNVIDEVTVQMQALAEKRRPAHLGLHDSPIPIQNRGIPSIETEAYTEIMAVKPAIGLDQNMQPTILATGKIERLRSGVRYEYIEKSKPYNNLPDDPLHKPSSTLGGFKNHIKRVKQNGQTEELLNQVAKEGRSPLGRYGIDKMDPYNKDNMNALPKSIRDNLEKRSYGKRKKQATDPFREMIDEYYPETKRSPYDLKREVIKETIEFERAPGSSYRRLRKEAERLAQAMDGRRANEFYEAIDDRRMFKDWLSAQDKNKKEFAQARDVIRKSFLYDPEPALKSNSFPEDDIWRRVKANFNETVVVEHYSALKNSEKNPKLRNLIHKLERSHASSARLKEYYDAILSDEKIPEWLQKEFNKAGITKAQDMKEYIEYERSMVSELDVSHTKIIRSQLQKLAIGKVGPNWLPTISGGRTVINQHFTSNHLTEIVDVMERKGYSRGAAELLIADRMNVQLIPDNLVGTVEGTGRMPNKFGKWIHRKSKDFARATYMGGMLASKSPQVGVRALKFAFKELKSLPGAMQAIWQNKSSRLSRLWAISGMMFSVASDNPYSATGAMIKRSNKAGFSLDHEATNTFFASKKAGGIKAKLGGRLYSFGQKLTKGTNKMSTKTMGHLIKNTGTFIRKFSVPTALNAMFLYSCISNYDKYQNKIGGLATEIAAFGAEQFGWALGDAVVANSLYGSSMMAMEEGIVAKQAQKTVYKASTSALRSAAKQTSSANFLSKMTRSLRGTGGVWGLLAYAAGMVAGSIIGSFMGSLVRKGGQAMFGVALPDMRVPGTYWQRPDFWNNNVIGTVGNQWQGFEPSGPNMTPFGSSYDIDKVPELQASPKVRAFEDTNVRRKPVAVPAVGLTYHRNRNQAGIGDQHVRSVPGPALAKKTHNAPRSDRGAAA